MNTLEDHGYVWRGSITEQDGAWLSYWVDDSSEGHRAHSSLAPKHTSGHASISAA